MSDAKNEDIIKIQNEIDTLEKKLFFDVNEPLMNDSNLINYTQNKIIENNNNLSQQMNKESLYNAPNVEQSNYNISKSNDNDNDNIKKIKELIELQKEIDILREKRGKKILSKTEKLHKAYTNSNGAYTHNNTTNKKNKNKNKNHK